MKAEWVNNRIALQLTLVLILILKCAVSGEKESENPEDYFLYGREEDKPVIDYRSENEKDPSRPDFIFGPNTGPRVVEFYSPWCPHVGTARILAFLIVRFIRVSHDFLHRLFSHSVRRLPISTSHLLKD
jgi:hypothetical protein